MKYAVNTYIGIPFIPFLGAERLKIEAASIKYIMTPICPFHTLCFEDNDRFYVITNLALSVSRGSLADTAGNQILRHGPYRLLRAILHPQAIPFRLKQAVTTEFVFCQ